MYLERSAVAFGAPGCDDAAMLAMKDLRKAQVVILKQERKRKGKGGQTYLRNQRKRGSFSTRAEGPWVTPVS